MNDSKKDKDLDPTSLPQKEAFETKEIYQHKQPADTGKPIENETGNAVGKDNVKDSEKASKEDGLNEERSDGDAGAFEGFEDHGK